MTKHHDLILSQDIINPILDMGIQGLPEALGLLINYARYEKARTGGIVRSCAVFTAIGIRSGDGKRTILGASVSLCWPLRRPPSGLPSAGEVVRHFDGYLAPIACVSVTDYKRCLQESVCRFRRVMLEARNMVARLMDKATLSDVMRGHPVSDQEITHQQGLGGEGI